MKAFNSYLEGKLVDLKNSKLEREEFEKIGKYLLSNKKEKKSSIF